MDKARSFPYDEGRKDGMPMEIGAKLRQARIAAGGAPGEDAGKKSGWAHAGADGGGAGREPPEHIKLGE